MSISQRRASPWAIAAAVAVVLVFLYLVHGVLLPFVIAAALAFVGTPLVKILRCRAGLPHWLAVVCVFTLFVGVAGGVAYWIHLVLVPQVIGLAKDLPRLIEQTLRSLLGGDRVNFLGQEISARELTREAVVSATSWFGTPGQLLSVAATGFQLVMATFLTLVLFFYMLLDGRKLFHGALKMVPPVMRSRARLLALRTRPMLIHYIQGVAIVVAYAAGLTYLGVGVVIRLPHAALLALTTGILELVPVIGPIASATLLGVVAIEQGLWATLAFAAFAVVLRLSIDQLVGPLVLGRAVTLHPVVIIFAFLAGGLLMGILGVLIAVPTAATIKIVLEHIYQEPARPK